MKVIVTTWYEDTFKTIFSSEVDNTVKSVRGKTNLDIVYSFKTDDNYQEVSQFLEYCKACTLIRSFKIER
jgi:hypothetical protein